MDDELDLRLEAHLRAALHHEADALPLLVRAEDVRRARRRRGGRRLGLPASLLAAAAVIAVVVVFGGMWRVNQAPVAASPTAGSTSVIPVQVIDTPTEPLPSYEDIAVYAASTVELLRAEHEAVNTPTQTVAGSLGAMWNLEIVVACDVGDVVVSLRLDGVASPGTDTDRATFGCGQEPGAILVTMLESAGDAQVVVDAPAGTSWRLIAYDHASNLKTLPDRLTLPDLARRAKLENQFIGVLSPAPSYAFSAEVSPVAPGTTFDVVFACDGRGLLHLVIDGTVRDAPCTASGTERFTAGGFGPSTFTLTSDHPVRLRLELRSMAATP